MTKACQCPRVYAVCSYRMPVEIHTIAIYSIYSIHYNNLKLQAEPCLHVFYVCVVLNSAFIYKLNLKCVFDDVVRNPNFGSRKSSQMRLGLMLIFFYQNFRDLSLCWYLGEFMDSSITLYSWRSNPEGLVKKQFTIQRIRSLLNNIIHQFSIQN